MKVGTYEAKTRLSELIKMLETKQEQEIIITNSGAPVARLVPFVAPAPRKLGLLQGKYILPEDIDDCNDEIAELFGV